MVLVQPGPFAAARALPRLRLDQRGHGDSERPACCYTIDDFAADIVAFLDGVGLTRATLVGHSASGFIARRVAETYPKRVARLVLINCAVTLPTQVRRSRRPTCSTDDEPAPSPSSGVASNV